MRTFLDVGAHYGETLDIALDPGWGFDRVVCFEPASRCVEMLRKYRDRRVEVMPFGLSNQTGTTTLYGAGLLGGSVYADKPQHQEGGREEIQLTRASDWIRDNTQPGDEVYLKLNCEGSEVDVLLDLLDADIANRVASVYVDFDASKIPSQQARVSAVETRLTAARVKHVTPTALGVGGNAGVHRWLSSQIPAREVGPPARLRHRARLYQPWYLWARDTTSKVLPRRLYWAIGHRVGRLQGGRARASVAK